MTRSELPAHLKVQMYKQKLQRFLNFQHPFRSSIPSRDDTIPQRQPQPLPEEKSTPVVSEAGSEATAYKIPSNWYPLDPPAKKKEQVPITPELTRASTSQGVSPFPTPLPFSRQRVQPPRMRKRTEWISYIKSSPDDRRNSPRDGRTRVKLEPVLQMPEKWIRHSDKQ